MDSLAAQHKGDKSHYRQPQTVQHKLYVVLLNHTTKAKQYSYAAPFEDS